MELNDHEAPTKARTKSSSDTRKRSKKEVIISKSLQITEFYFLILDLVHLEPFQPRVLSSPDNPSPETKLEHNKTSTAGIKPLFSCDL